MRRPGTAVVEFMEPMAPDLPREVFMAELERTVEVKSNALMQEAGFEAHAEN